MAHAIAARLDLHCFWHGRLLEPFFFLGENLWQPEMPASMANPWHQAEDICSTVYVCQSTDIKQLCQTYVYQICQTYETYVNLITGAFHVGNEVS